MVVDHDIILDGNKKPRRWLIPVLIGSLVILILIGIVAFAVSRSGRSTAGSLEAALSQYLTLVEQGPADDTEGVKIQLLRMTKMTKHGFCLANKLMT